MELKLNVEQEELKSKIFDFVDSNQKGYFGIFGAAGTGKTFVISKSLNQFKKKKILFLGATNKVCSVLKESLKNSGFENPNVKTIDSFLKFKIKKDHENKSTIHYTFPKVQNLPEVLVVDEISMITYQKFELLENLKEHCAIILIGDYLQLPPIEEENQNVVRNKNGFKMSKIFMAIPKENRFELKIQNRQKEGTPLFDLVKWVRQNMHNPISPYEVAKTWQNGNDIFFFKTNSKELKETIKESKTVAVCFKNLTVLNFNWLIGSTKSMKKDYKLNEINEGDDLMFDSFYYHKSKNTETSFYTSNIVNVLKINKNQTETFTIKTKMIKAIVFDELEVLDSDNKIHKIRYVHGGLYGKNGGGVSQSVYGQRQTFLEKIKRGFNVEENKKFLRNLNTKFANYQNSFAKLKRPYAITAHKAQGSTYENVIIPVYDYYQKFHQDANQLFYVALSRAKKRIIFVEKETQFRDNSNRYNFSEFERFSIASNFDYKCNNCSIDVSDREFDVDHKIPISNGGSNLIDNLQILCKTCHKNKTANEKQ